MDRSGLFSGVPANWRQRRGWIGAGLLLACPGILLFTAGAIHNSNSGFALQARLVEGEVTVLPSVPFVAKLERFDLDFQTPATQYGEDDGPSMPERRAIRLSLLRNGQVFEQVTTQLGQPVSVEGFELSPSDTESGWAFDLAVRDPGGREKVVPVEPWNPPLIRLGLTRQHVFADRVAIIGNGQGADPARGRPNAAEIYLVEDGNDRQLLGFATATQPVSASGYMVSAWRIRPYVGLTVSSNPGRPMVLAGIACLLAGILVMGCTLWSPARRRSRRERV